jgi:hypothetical protein
VFELAYVTLGTDGDTFPIIDGFLIKHNNKPGDVDGDGGLSDCNNGEGAGITTLPKIKKKFHQLHIKKT